MTGTQRSSADLDVRRRKILFRSWHRGIREMDLIMGQFADAHINVHHHTAATQRDVYFGSCCNGCCFNHPSPASAGNDIVTPELHLIFHIGFQE